MPGPVFCRPCPCVPGWGFSDEASLRVLRLGVDSRAVPLYEVEDGERYRITHWPAGIPVARYLEAQARFAHLTESEIAQIEAEVDRRWDALTERAARTPGGPSTEPRAAPVRAR